MKTPRVEPDVRRFYATAAPHYDADYAALGYAADIAFYRDLAVACDGPVLEMACGTGRVLLPTARAGVRIDGLDASAGMLRCLRRKLAEEPRDVRRRVRMVRGDMRTTAMGRTYALITAPFRGVQHLLERSDQRAWLANVARHLAPGGVLCFDVFQPNYRMIAHPPKARVDVDRRDPRTGRRVRRLVEAVSYPEAQRLEVRFRWRSQKVQSSGRMVFRWFTRAELENLLELAGFRILDYWGSFDRKPFGPGSPHQIVRATLRSHAKRS